jgi:tRNA A37 threonylcarbamoyladenosine synthetase subunit TsaC/SUA5/YrdC
LPARNDIPRPLVKSLRRHRLAHLERAHRNGISEMLGRPLTATSANPSGSEPARTVAEAQNYFSAVIDQFVDGGHAFFTPRLDRDRCWRRSH